MVSSNIILISISFFIQVYTIKKNGIEKLFRPKIVIPGFILLNILMGNLNLIYFQEIIGWYSDIEGESGNFYALVGILTFQFILLFPTKEKKKILYSNSNSNSNFNHLTFLFCKVLTFFSLIFNTLNYYSLGGLLIFKSNLDGYERFDLNLPFDKALYLSSFLLTLTFIGLTIDKINRNKYLLMFLINLVFSIGIGSRHLILMPLITALLFLNWGGYISSKKAVIFGFFGVFILIMLSFLRGDSENIIYSSWQSAFGGEYRDYLRLTTEPNMDYQEGKTIRSILLNPIPKQFYSLIDLDKEDYRVYSAYILQEIWGNETGQRSGIWGEFYLNWGKYGVIICFVFYSFIVRILDYKITNIGNYDKGKLIVYSYFYSLVFFSILGSWATIGDDLGTYGLFYLIFYYTIKFLHNNNNNNGNSRIRIVQ